MPRRKRILKTTEYKPDVTDELKLEPKVETSLPETVFATPTPHEPAVTIEGTDVSKLGEKKIIAKVDPSNPLTDKLTEDLQTLTDKVTEMGKVLVKLENHVDKISAFPTEPPTNNSLETNQEATEGVDSDIIKAVREILDDRFHVTISPMNDGINFRLLIVPPPHLKEHENDTRQRVVPYLEGGNGAKVYAKQVKVFCVNWATRNGVSYE